MPQVPSRTGFELELLAPPGMTRVSWAAHVAHVQGWQLLPFETFSKVPVPSAASLGIEGDQVSEALVLLMQDVARHHEAELCGFTDDSHFAYLRHRAAHLASASGAPLFDLVHDNTLAGGERVVEIVSAPFDAAAAPTMFNALGQLLATPGLSVPASAALHVHLDGAPFCDPVTLTRLVALFLLWEPTLRVWLQTPSDLRAAGPLPMALPVQLQALVQRGGDWADTKQLLQTLMPSRAYGLNLYNLSAGEPEKLTIELKLAAVKLDVGWVRATCALFAGLASLALDLDAELPGDSGEALLCAIDTDAVIRRGLGLSTTGSMQLCGK